MAVSYISTTTTDGSPIKETSNGDFFLSRFELAEDLLLQVMQWRGTGKYSIETYDVSETSWTLLDSYENDQSFTFGWWDQARFYEVLEMPRGNRESFTTFAISSGNGNVIGVGSNLPYYGGAGSGSTVLPGSLQEKQVSSDGIFEESTGTLYQYSSDNQISITAFDVNTYASSTELTYGTIIASSSVSTDEFGYGDFDKLNNQMGIVEDKLFASYEPEGNRTSSVLLSFDKATLELSDDLVLDETNIWGLVTSGVALYILTSSTERNPQTNRYDYYLSKYDTALVLDSTFGTEGKINLTEAVPGATRFEAEFANDNGVVTLNAFFSDHQELITVDFLGNTESLSDTRSTGDGFTEVISHDMILVTDWVDRPDGSVIFQSSVVADLDLQTLNSAFESVTALSGATIQLTSRSLVTVESDATALGSSEGDIFELVGDSSVVIGGAGADEIRIGETDFSYIESGAGDDRITVDPSQRWSIDNVYAVHVSGSGVSTGQQVLLTGEYDQSTSFIIGGAGNDTVTFGDGHDAIALDDFVTELSDYSSSEASLANINEIARFSDIEVVNAGAGQDIIDFSSTSFGIDGITLEGGDGQDIIWGSDLSEVINGGAENDIINGGDGDDTLTGGAGSDRFEFTATTGTDTITDFGNGNDYIQFYLRDGFGEDESDALPTLSENTFALGSSLIEVTLFEDAVLTENSYSIIWI